MIIYFLCLLLFAIGIYCIIRKRNIIKIIIGIMISEYAVNLFLVVVGYRRNAQAPIYGPGGPSSPVMVDPLPQALVLTSIVIGLAVVSLMVVIAMRLYEKYGTFDITKIRRLKG